jgi:uncharacterized membrane protein YbhN (UPF0104 family)
MAAGILTALVLFLFLAPDAVGSIDWSALRNLLTQEPRESAVFGRRTLVLIASVLLIPLAVAVSPPVFNWLMRHMARPFQKNDAAPLPRMHLTALAKGLALTVLGWFFFGASLWAVFQAMLSEPPPWSWQILGLYTAYLGTAYVAGFVIVIVPGGLGVREFFLTLFLTPELAPFVGGDTGRARATALVAVVILRLVWTASELPAAGLLYILPVRGRADSEADLSNENVLVPGDRKPEGGKP